MPKTKFENIVFTLLMSFLMVYAMICYNIALNMGGMSNQVFLLSFHELIIIWPVAFILEMGAAAVAMLGATGAQAADNVAHSAASAW